ncbi:MAG: ATP-binding protein [Campylobacterota bacterium]|nr:ATP-binding protein [Campylobacterota bacterium]
MKYKFILSFVVIVSVIISLLVYEKKNKIDHILNKHSKDFRAFYNAVYKQYKEEANIIFKTVVDNNKIIDIYTKIKNSDKKTKDIQRKVLYNLIKDEYSSLKFVSIRQLHFHLNNNISFLRMHRPNKYGDNLTDVRLTVKYVNQFHKNIDGFEEGRIFNGFRFVFPIMDKTKHLGSVEISFSADAIISKLTKEYNKDCNLHISKAIVDEKIFLEEKTNYTQSPFAGFLIDKEVYRMIYKKDFDINTKSMPSKKIRNIAIEHIKNNSNILSLYDSKIDKVVTILPILNPITGEKVAFISSKNNIIAIENLNKSFWYISILVILTLFLIFFYIYKQQKYKNELEKSLENQKKQILKEQNKNREKDRLLYQQSKMASIGEMIENIAHQWRQPLSIISTNASGLIVQNEFNNLTNSMLEKSLEDILNTSNKLSKTIDEFRNYFQSSGTKDKINIDNIINKSIYLLSSKLEDNNITIKKNTIDTDIFALESEIIQVVLILLNNSIDALKNIDKKDNLILINLDKKNEESKEYLILDIKDNGGGIQSDDINKVFEPYYTTKHKSQGTGIGLFMATQIITKNMGGSIVATNEEFVYNDISYFGANFRIKFLINDSVK